MRPPASRRETQLGRRLSNPCRNQKNPSEISSNGNPAAGPNTLIPSSEPSSTATPARIVDTGSNTGTTSAANEERSGAGYTYHTV